MKVSVAFTEIFRYFELITFLDFATASENCREVARYYYGLKYADYEVFNKTRPPLIFDVKFENLEVDDKKKTITFRDGTLFLRFIRIFGNLVQKLSIEPPFRYVEWRLDVINTRFAFKLNNYFGLYMQSAVLRSLHLEDVPESFNLQRLFSIIQRNFLRLEFLSLDVLATGLNDAVEDNIDLPQLKTLEFRGDYECIKDFNGSYLECISFGSHVFDDIFNYKQELLKYQNVRSLTLSLCYLDADDDFLLLAAFLKFNLPQLENLRMNGEQFFSSE